MSHSNVTYAKTGEKRDTRYSSSNSSSGTAVNANVQHVRAHTHQWHVVFNSHYRTKNNLFHTSYSPGQLACREDFAIQPDPSAL